MSGGMKALLLIGLVLYVIFPDPIPGPVDDLILCIVYAIMSHRPRIENA